MGTTSSLPEDRIGEALRRDPELQRSKFPSQEGRTLILQPPTSPTPRTLGYEIYGETDIDTRKHALLFFHGTPGTRFFFTSTHSELALRHGITIVVPERPGFGLSTPWPERTLQDAANDAKCLLDHLGISSVHVLGYSAGGPYAFAFAHEFSTRCQSLSVVSSLSPNARGVMRGMTVLSRVGYLLAVHAPGMLRIVVRKLALSASEEVFDDRREDFSQVENEFFRGRADVRKVFARCALELYSRPQGAVAEAEDYALMARDWGFPLQGIGGEFDIRVYAGALDCKCTLGMFRVLVERLPQGRVRPLLAEGEAHLHFYKLFEDGLLSDLGIC